MAQNYLSLLDTAVRTSADYFGRIERTLDTGFAASENIRQFDASMALKSSQFNAQMALNDRELAERTRMNNIAAENMRFNNDLRSKEFEHKLFLLPLEMEEAQVRLETAKVNQKRALQETKDRNFNSITSPIDIQAAAFLAKSRNANFGNDYLTLKSKYQAQVGQGMEFNEREYVSEFNALRDQYGASEPSKEYNPDVATLLERMGAPAEAARMRAESPVFAGNIQGLKAGALLAGPRAVNEMIATYGFAFKNDEETNSFIAAAQAYDGYGKRILSLEDEKRRIYSSLERTKLPDQRQILEDKINDIDKRIIETDNLKQKVYLNAVGVAAPEQVNYNEPDDLAEYRRRNSLALEQIKEIRETVPEVAGVFDNNREFTNKQANIGDYKIAFPEALGNISFRGWAGHNPRDSMDYAKNLRNDIVRNISTLPFDERDENPNNLPRLSDLIQSDAFKDVFKRLEGKAVPVPRITGGSKTTYIGNRSVGQFLFGNGIFSNSAGVSAGVDSLKEIDSYETALEVIRDYQGSPESKRLFVEKLYASVIAAGAVDQMSK